MLIRLDMRSDQPIYSQIEEAVRNRIEEGSVKGGEHLPSARSLAASLDVNMHTVLKAYSGLEQDGFVEMRRGRGGVVVTDRPVLESLLQAVVETAQGEGISQDEVFAIIKEMWK